jgi:hypothetical protein
MFSPYVTLPTQQQPVIPHRCAICDADGPDESVECDVGVSLLIWGYVARWLPGRRFVTIPVCARCRRASLMHDVVFFVFALLSVAAAALWVTLNGNLFAANFVAGLLPGVAILGPAMVWSWWRLMSPAIQIHSHLFGVSYQFRGRRFLEEFCQANAHATIEVGGLPSVTDVEKR